MGPGADTKNEGGMFGRLSKSTYPELVAERIKRQILERKLKPGDRLPSQAELAAEFDVSRASIREAIQSLSGLGLIEVRPGHGTFVSNNLAESIHRTLSLGIGLSEGVAQDLVEMRKIIEPAIAALAAERADEGDKAKMAENLQRMERAIGNPAEVAEADLEFHLIMTRSTGNLLLWDTMVGIQHLLRPLMGKFTEGIEGQRLAVRQHRQVYEAIERGDAHGARLAMLGNVEKDIKWGESSIESDDREREGI